MRPGATALGNLGGGVNLDNDASGNTIGGIKSSARNVISGSLADAMFNGDGVSLRSGPPQTSSKATTSGPTSPEPSQFPTPTMAFLLLTTQRTQSGARIPGKVT